MSVLFRTLGERKHNGAVADARVSAETTEQTLVAGDGSRAIAFVDIGDAKTQALTSEAFLRQVRGVAAQLPAGSRAINLCEDRYRFLVALCALALRGQTALLPQSRAPALIAETLQRYPGSYCVGDQNLQPPPPEYWRLPDLLPEIEGAPPRIDPAALAVIGFTSGSTGDSVAHSKTWASFAISTQQNLTALRDLWPAGSGVTLVATVPPQHMYGMELSVLLPLLADVAVHAARPFFPDDIARALFALPAPRLLVTTPVHLRALLESGVAVPPLAGIVSATAPMPQELARQAETQYGCELRELFGSTETCVIARRRPAHEQVWSPFPGVVLHARSDGTVVEAPHLAAPVTLSDLVEVVADGRFLLCGRNSDLLEIAGKRASLGDLTRKLQAVPGVIDGVVFQLDARGRDGVCRIAALAVAPGLEAASILKVLRCNIDPVFLPRPLRCVPELPRNETGKLPRAQLRALLRSRDQTPV